MTRRTQPDVRSGILTTPHATLFTRAAAALMLAAGVTACGGDAERGDAQRGQTERGDAEPAAVAAGDSILPNAPSPRVRRAVRKAALEVEEGHASFYADQFEGRRTASGRPFRQQEMVAAHRAFPFGTRLRVSNPRTGKEVEVEVVDRGPFAQAGALSPILDLSRAAAERLDFVREGKARVRVEVVAWGR